MRSDPMQSRIWRVLVRLAVFAFIFAVPPPLLAQTVEGRFERTLAVSGPVDLSVTTGSGRVDVRPGAANSVQIVGRIRAQASWLGSRLSPQEQVRRLEAEPPVEQSRNSIRVGEIKDSDLRNHVSIDFDITVPPQCTLTTRTGSGDQHIGSLSGPVTASSGSGSITLADIRGLVTASTGSGDIQATDLRAGLKAHTGSGSIVARTVSGDVTASTGSGNIDVMQSAPGSVTASAASGDVRLHGVQGALKADSASGDVFVQGVPAASWTVSTASGDITLELPAGQAFDLEARTRSGRIDSKHPITVAGTTDRHRLSGKVAGGGPLVRLQTASGDIELR